ncbi:MAG TPA: adenylate/guanylate cyclase domain-containing protein, partial [Methylomirabilota bacterium]|nr:adenylate/guanylate cyclase domain-containing protein [Methylomirabilota bacterium]
GERKMVTVLFCDLQGSTPLAERIGPERMHDLLNRFFELALAAVHRYEGSVNQFLGDGFMALFGAPIAHEDHAARAAFAALEIRESVGTLNVELATQGTPLHIRLGINTGPVVVGGIGDNLRMDYTAIGDTTNLASRLQTLAEPDTVLVSESTYELIQPYLQCTPLGVREVKGKAHPVPVFRVDGARERRTRFDLSLERGLTALVGRQWEMGLIQSRWTEVLASRGQAVVLIGEAGVGKSRLLYEFRQLLPDHAVAFEGRCLPYERGVSYAPVVEILRRYFSIGDQEKPDEVREKVKAGVERFGAELRETLPFLLNLFSEGLESGALATLDSSQIKRLTQEAVIALLLAASRATPLCLTIEDCHWTDENSKELLARLVGRLSGARILLCVTTRPGAKVPAEGRTAMTQIAMNPLSNEETVAVARRLIGEGDLPSEVGELIVKKTGGYPLYVEELLRSLLDKGQLTRTPGGVEIAAPLSEAEVPDTIHDIIMARIDQLDGETKRALQLASVVGHEFDFPLLQAVAETTSAELMERLDQLKAQEFIDEASAFPQRRYVFRHNLVQEVAYGALLQRRRSEWHELVGAALERLGGGAIDERLPALADHYARSANQKKALHYLLLAGDQVTRQYAHGRAQAFWERALGLLDTGPDEPGVRRQLLDRLGDAHFAQGAFEQALTTWQRALELAVAANDRFAVADLRRKIGVTYWSLGDPESAIAHFMTGLDVLVDVVDCLERARLFQELARITFRLGRHEEATRWAEQALALGERLEAPDVVSHASNTIGLALARVGEIERGAEAVKRSLETALAHDLHSVACRAYANLAVLYTTIDQDRSAAFCTEGLALAEKIGDLTYQSWLQCTLAGRSCTLAGDYEEGVKAARASIELDRRLGHKSHLPIPLIILAQIYQCHGEFTESERYYREALALAEESEEPQLLIPCYDGLATLAIEQGNEAEAERYLERSRRLMEETGWESDSLLVLPFLS